MNPITPPPLTRRSFLQLSATLTAGAILGQRLLAAEDDPYGALVPGAQSYTFRAMSFDDCLAAMESLGLREIEIFPNHIKRMETKQVLDACSRHDVKIVSYGVVAFTRSLDGNRKLFEIAKSLGCKNLSCDPSPDAFDSLDKLTEEYDISAAIHPHGPGHRWAKIDTIWNAVKDHSPKIGLCNDTGHLIRAGEDPVRACEVFKDRLFALHLKDFKKAEDGTWKDVPLGQGSLAVDDVVKFLLDHAFKGALLIEYEGGDEVESVRQSLARLRQAVKAGRA